MSRHSMTSSSVFQIGLYSKHYYAFKQLGMRGCYIVNVVTATGHMTQTQSNARNPFIWENIHSKEQTQTPYRFSTVLKLASTQQLHTHAELARLLTNCSQLLISNYMTRIIVSINPSKISGNIIRILRSLLDYF